MKKIKLLSLLSLVAIAVQAQDREPDFDPLKDRQFYFDILNITGIMLVIYLISKFITTLLKQNFDYRLRSKMIEKGTEENIVSQLVAPTPKNPRSNVLQWFFVLAGIAVGFTIVDFTRPFGLHSLAIMAFCVAAGFAGNYYATRKQAL